MSKMRFFSIKHPNSNYTGVFIAENEEIARDIAKKNNFKIDESTIFEDITVEMTGADKLHLDTVIDGSNND